MNQAQAMAKLYEVSFSRFGKPIIYIPAGGEAKEILAVIHFGPLPAEQTRGGQSVREDLARIMIRADATLGIPSPARRDQVAITAPSGAQEVWQVDKAPEGDGAVWRLDLIRDRRPVPGR